MENILLFIGFYTSPGGAGFIPSTVSLVYFPKIPIRFGILKDQKVIFVGAEACFMGSLFFSLRNGRKQMALLLEVIYIYNSSYNHMGVSKNRGTPKCMV